MSNYSNKKIQEFAAIFKALSNPNRLKIFTRLVSCCQPGTIASLNNGTQPEEGCACVGELGQDLNIAPSTISHHIKELRQAGLISIQRSGQKIECWVDPKTLTAIKDFFP